VAKLLTVKNLQVEIGAIDGKRYRKSDYAMKFTLLPS